MPHIGLLSPKEHGTPPPAPPLEGEGCLSFVRWLFLPAASRFLLGALAGRSDEASLVASRVRFVFSCSLHPRRSVGPMRLPRRCSCGAGSRGGKKLRVPGALVQSLFPSCSPPSCRA